MQLRIRGSSAGEAASSARTRARNSPPRLRPSAAPPNSSNRRRRSTRLRGSTYIVMGCFIRKCRSGQRKGPQPSGDSTSPLAGLCPHQGFVFEPMRAVGVGAEAFVALDFVHLVVPLEPDDVRVSLEGQNVRGNAVEKPAVVGGDDRTAAEVGQAFFERPQRGDVEVVGRFIEQDAGFRRFAAVWRGGRGCVLRRKARRRTSADRSP